MYTTDLITLINEIRPGAKRACVGIVRGGRIGIVPFWDVEFSCTGSGEWDSAGEGAIDEEFLFARAGKGNEVLVIDAKKRSY
jgi:hypothetical protein